MIKWSTCITCIPVPSTRVFNMIDISSLFNQMLNSLYVMFRYSLIKLLWYYLLSLFFLFILWWLNIFFSILCAETIGWNIFLLYFDHLHRNLYNTLYLIHRNLYNMLYLIHRNLYNMLYLLLHGSIIIEAILNWYTCNILQTMYL